VTSLIHPAPNDAKHMLESFIQYLRGSLASSRESTTTLGREFDLMRDFLEILKIRMGDRLQTELALSDELRGVNLPPMLIQPMVENAIKHGLEPKMEGGQLRLAARKEDDRLVIEIADTGMGFSGATSNGVGLRNVRERLKALYDDAARLTIEDNTPCGTRILIHLPLAPAAA
jgi:sensor histidine kinase YesM